MIQISSGLLHMKINFTFIYYVKSLHKGFYFGGHLCCNMKATKVTPSETTALSLMSAYLLDMCARKESSVLPDNFESTAEIIRERVMKLSVVSPPVLPTMPCPIS